MKDSDIWKILEGVISLDQKDIVAHSAENELPSDETREALKRFASGDIGAEERAQLCVQLRDNPSWVTFLADCVKQQRPV